MRKPIVRRSRNLPAVKASDGAEVVELFGNHCMGIEGTSLASGELTRGRMGIPHYHRLSDETCFIIAGYGKVRVGDEEYDLAPGDAIFIPHHYVHSLENTGPKPLQVLCFCSPPFDESDFYRKLPGEI